MIRWYLSAAAVRQYCRIAGIDDDDGGPGWAQAERELAAHAEVARHVGRSSEGTDEYRTGRVQCGTRTGVRLELYVRPAPRAEGSLPQLVRVRDKGGRQGQGASDRARHARKAR